MKISKLHPTIRAFLVGIIIGLILIWIPLFQQFHYESAALAAMVGCFWAGGVAAKKPTLARLFHVLITVYAVAIPLLINTLAVGCLSWDGSALWVLLPFPSVVFGFSVGRVIYNWQLPAPRLWTIGFLIWVALGVWLLEFYHLPQVRFFNHVWGWFPGPIYDEAITVSPSLLMYRGSTMLWALLLWYLPQISRDRWSVGIVAGSAILLITSYGRLVDMDIITPRAKLKQELSRHETKGHVALYAAPNAFKVDEISVWDEKLESYWSWLSDTLQVSLPQNQQVEAYLYRHAWQKKAKVGAKFTSYVPVWLEQPQLHIAATDLNRVALHEMVHIASKQFGNKLFGASWNIGLVEGLAVALSGNRSDLSTIDQLAAADSSVTTNENLKRALSFEGFYTGRSTVGYTVMGSFVQWLLKNYSVKKFKRAYANGRLEEAFQVPIDTLIDGWQRHLETVPLDTTDLQAAQQLFSIPSLFEQRCPHQVTAFEAQWDEYRKARVEHDTSRTLQLVDHLYRKKPNHPTVLNHWMYWQLASGESESIIQLWNQQSALVDSLPPILSIRAADAYQMSGDTASSQKVLQSVIDEYPYLEQKESIELRKQADFWNDWLMISYKSKIPESIERPNPERPIFLEQTALFKALQRQQSEMISTLTTRHLKSQYDDSFWNFELALQTADYLAYRGQISWADELMSIAEQEIKRPRDRERWEQQMRWFSYLK